MDATFRKVNLGCMFNEMTRLLDDSGKLPSNAMTASASWIVDPIAASCSNKAHPALGAGSGAFASAPSVAWVCLGAPRCTPVLIGVHTPLSTPKNPAEHRMVMKLPSSLTKGLTESADVFQDIIEGKSGHGKTISVHLKKNLQGEEITHEDGESLEDPMLALRKHMIDDAESEIDSVSQGDLKKRSEEDGKSWLSCLQRIWALGQRRVEPNILLVPNSMTLGRNIEGSGLMEVSDENSKKSASIVKGNGSEFDSFYMEVESLESSVVSGFQLAIAAGPLCDEPMWVLALLVEAYIISSQVITFVKEACKSSMHLKRPHLVEALYFCEVSTPTEHLGHAYVPVAESFGFADELKRWTSGAASPQLLLSHWEALPQDPFFVPKIEEELEEVGDGSSVPPNTARKMIDIVRMMQEHRSPTDMVKKG
eukprot:Gb_08720 [translate_table: standard]